MDTNLAIGRMFREHDSTHGLAGGCLMAVVSKPPVFLLVCLRVHSWLKRMASVKNPLRPA